jgi:hypothetical protein
VEIGLAAKVFLEKLLPRIEIAPKVFGHKNFRRDWELGIRNWGCKPKAHRKKIKTSEPIQRFDSLVQMPITKNIKSYKFLWADTLM